MPYEEASFVIAHRGGGISVGAHSKGRVVDVNNALDGDGPFSPERAGSLPTGGLVKFCFSGTCTLEEMKKKIVGQGGMVAHLGTNDLREAEKLVTQGDEKAELVVDAMAYQVAKEIGSRAVALEGKMDAVILTGGLAYGEDFVRRIRRRIDWMGKVLVYPGEDEMQALAEGGLRVLRGEERPRTYEG
jgi:butyrate kinase